MLLLTCSGEKPFYAFVFCLWPLYFILEHLVLFFLFSFVCCFYISGMNLTQNAKSKIQDTLCACVTFSSIVAKLTNKISKISLVEDDMQTEPLIKLPKAFHCRKLV